MSLNPTVRSKRVRQDAGIALVTTILLLLMMSSLLVGFSVLLYTDLQLSGSSDDQVRAFYGAEAGMEQMTAKARQSVLPKLFPEHRPDQRDLGRASRFARNSIPEGRWIQRLLHHSAGLRRQRQSCPHNWHD